MNNAERLYWQFSETIFALMNFTLEYELAISFLAGLFLPFLFFRQDPHHKKLTVVMRLIALFGVTCFFFGTVAPFTVSGLVNLYNLHPSRPTSYRIENYSWWILIGITIIGVTFHIILRRMLSPEIDRMKHAMVRKTKLSRDQRTDVREIKDLLPTPLDYNPMNYLKLPEQLFIGLDDRHKPKYIPMENWQKQHADIIGTTGAGKGVACALLLYQSILAGEGVFVLDPKNDEWAPHLYKKACEDAGKPFVLIDLNQNDYQMNLIEGINAEHLEELLIAGLSLSDKGETADFYRIDDRRAARATAQLIKEHPQSTLRTLFNGDYVQSLYETIKGFFGKIEELAILNSINATEGFSLKEIFDNGGCCYIIGSMRNSKVVMAQRMILVRLIQVAELRDRVNTKPRPIAIFLDELKYHISKPAMEGLGAARDKGVHIIMAHQSIDDLRDCPGDLNPDAVVGAVVENTKFKLVYGLMDPDTAEWVARMSGTILVDDETRTAKTTQMLTEEIDDKRSIRQAERYFIDSNMLLSLPNLVGFVFVRGSLPSAALISPIKVDKQDLLIHAVEQEDVPVKQPGQFKASAAKTSEEVQEKPEEATLPEEKKKKWGKK